MKFKISDMVKIPKNVVSKNVAQDIVVLNLDDGTYFKLNETGAFVWQILLQGAPVSQVIEEMAKTYEVSSITAERDIMALITNLERERLLNLNRKEVNA